MLASSIDKAKKYSASLFHTKNTFSVLFVVHSMIITADTDRLRRIFNEILENGTSPRSSANRDATMPELDKIIGISNDT